MDSNQYNVERRPGNIRCRGHIHVVQKGDTLYKLSRKYDVKLFDVMQANPYVNVYNLQIGDEICIPTTSPRPERRYVVNEGDTIQDVLNTLRVDFNTLARWNPTLLEVELPEGLVITLPQMRDIDDTMEDFFEDDDNQ